MTALVRYLAADVLRGQRWAAPLLAYLAAVLIVTPPQQGPLPPTFALSAAALLPAALWLTVVVFHSEEPVQGAVTLVTAGSIPLVWLAKCVTAYLYCLALALIAVAWISLSTGDPPGGATLGVGLADHLLTAYAGVAFGALLSRPILNRIAWTVLLGTGICLTELLVSPLPPVNALLALHIDAPDRALRPLALIAAETVALATAFLATAHFLSRGRT